MLHPQQQCASHTCLTLTLGLTNGTKRLPSRDLDVGSSLQPLHLPQHRTSAPYTLILLLRGKPRFPRDAGARVKGGRHQEPEGGIGEARAEEAPLVGACPVAAHHTRLIFTEHSFMSSHEGPRREEGGRHYALQKRLRLRRGSMMLLGNLHQYGLDVGGNAH